MKNIVENVFSQVSIDNIKFDHIDETHINAEGDFRMKISPSCTENIEIKIEKEEY